MDGFPGATSYYIHHHQMLNSTANSSCGPIQMVAGTCILVERQRHLPWPVLVSYDHIVSKYLNVWTGLGIYLRLDQ